jgi:hypothetical protein
VVVIESKPKYKFIRCGVLKVQYRKAAQNKRIEKDSERSMTVTGALPLCGKIKYKYTCSRIKGPHFWV